MTTRSNIESSKIESLIPRQLIADAGGLIEFIKEYYRFMHEEQGPSHVINNVLANKDIDTVVDAFISLVEKEIGAGFTTNLVANKTNLYKHIVQFYQAKGSAESFKLLFRLLYDTDIDISFPKEKILIASDGRWIQQNSIFIEITEGDPFDLFANILDVTTPDRIIKVEVERIRRVEETAFYEIFITKDNNTSRVVTGATIDQYGVKATVVNSLNKYEIYYPGTGFETAQFVDIVESSGEGVKIKVTEVDTLTGALTDIKFITFGVGYSPEFYAMVIPRSEIVGGVDLVISTDPDADKVTYPSRAIIKFSESVLAEYRGEYATNNGFLSDDIYLQDNFFYQQFSYLIRSSQQFDNYKDIVNKTVHPSGMAMFGEFEINNSFDMSRAFELLRRYFTNREEDAIDTIDLNVWTLYKPREDVAYASTTDWFHDFYKNVSEIVNVPDPEFKDFFKVLGDTALTSDELTYAITKLKELVENLAISELAIVSYAKPLTEVINSNDSGVIEILDDIYAENYFAEDYSEGLTSFT